jgi:hypothetical protein
MAAFHRLLPSREALYKLRASPSSDGELGVGAGRPSPPAGGTPATPGPPLDGSPPPGAARVSGQILAMRIAIASHQWSQRVSPSTERHPSSVCQSRLTRR